MKKRVLQLTAAILAALLLSVQSFAVPRTLIPGGRTMGIKIYSRGLLVTGFERQSAARTAGLRKGDLIVAADGEEVRTVGQLRAYLRSDKVVLTVQRSGKEAEFCVTPCKTEEGSKIGAYIKDSMSGIGTVTYYDPGTGEFGALGHGVNDRDTMVLLPVEAGVVVESEVQEVKKGSSGTPGELKGKFDVEQILGHIEHNTEHGIFGELKVPVPGKPIPVAQAGEVELGAATILSNVSADTVEAYAVKVLEIRPHEKESGRNLLIEVTDPRLLTTTGGIVQGMSGSPIIQDGKLVGAVTHVLVNDPTRGYGIFIENMLDAAG